MGCRSFPLGLRNRSRPLQKSSFTNFSRTFQLGSTCARAPRYQIRLTHHDHANCRSELAHVFTLQGLHSCVLLSSTVLSCLPTEAPAPGPDVQPPVLVNRATVPLSVSASLEERVAADYQVTAQNVEGGRNTRQVITAVLRLLQVSRFTSSPAHPASWWCRCATACCRPQAQA